MDGVADWLVEGDWLSGDGGSQQLVERRGEGWVGMEAELADNRVEWVFEIMKLGRGGGRDEDRTVFFFFLGGGKKMRERTGRTFHTTRILHS